uniref:RING-type domain-containing protein n=1 Tax=viral metagenome TaxID=1070528 RepID=A0A6C0C3P5_9ZZZZ
MNEHENNELLLQYMRIVVSQQEGILEALTGMRRQNDNLSAILAQELIRRHNTAIPNRIRTNRPRTRTFFSNPISPINRDRIQSRISTHRRSNNIPGTTDRYTNTLTQDILNATMNDSPVRVRPSITQLRRATRTIMFRDISNTTQTICPIDRELLEPDDIVLQIIHCGHFFRDSNLRRHFRGNTRCPLCRFDIREYLISPEEALYNNNGHGIPEIPTDGLASSIFDNTGNPFETRYTINPSQHTSREIQTILGEAISDILNRDSSNNILE